MDGRYKFELWGTNGGGKGAWSSGGGATNVRLAQGQLKTRIILADGAGGHCGESRASDGVSGGIDDGTAAVNTDGTAPICGEWDQGRDSAFIASVFKRE